MKSFKPKDEPKDGPNDGDTASGRNAERDFRLALAAYNLARMPRLLAAEAA